MATLPANNTFEGSSDETTITTGNSGGGSGTAFEVVTIDSGNGLVYDSARAAHGSFSARVVIGGTGNLAQCGWTFSPETEIWGRVYVYLTAAPAQHLRLVGWEDTGAVTAPGRILINTFNGGVVQVLDSNFVGDFASAVIPKNEWVRIEYRLVCHPTAGIIEAKMYQADSLTPITNGTVTSVSRDTESAVNRATYGHNAGWPSGTMTFWMDDLQVNDSGWPGPAGLSQQVLLPDADTDAGGWTATPLHSKLADSSDATVITATAS